MSSNKYLSSVSAFFSQAARRMVVAGVSGALTLALAGCGGGTTTAQDAQASATGTESGTTEVVQSGVANQAADETDASVGDYHEVASGFTIDASDLFSSRDLDSSYDEKTATKVTLADSGSKVEGSGATVDGTTVTINEEGTYVLSGTLSDGRVVVDVADTQKVQLVLAGASVTSSTGTALYVRSADKVFLTLADGTKNTLAATGAATEEDDHTLDGAVFASDDLTVNGSGSLVVTSAAGSGVVGKDELTLVSGTIDVTAAKHAVEAKDSLAARDGSYNLVAGSDGLHVEHDTNGTKGFVYVAGGTFAITAGDDGVHASNDIQVDGGSMSVSAEGDGIHSEYDLVINAGTVDVTKSGEGLEGARVQMNGGDVHVVASDDGVNASGDPDQTDGTDGQTSDMAQIPEGDMGQMPQNGQMPEGDMGQMPEGMARPEGGRGQMPEGDMGQMPQDGQMPEGGKMPHGGMGGGMMDADESATLTIAGGKLVVEAEGDGLDSNGALVVSGGETYVAGPTNSGNGPLDFGTTATVTGGVLIAAGSSGMAESFGGESSQGSMLVSASGEAGDLIELRDASGSVLASFTTTKPYSCVIATAPGVVEGGTYTVAYGAQTTEVTLDSIAYRDVQGGMGGMGRGGFGGRGMMGADQSVGQGLEA